MASEGHAGKTIIVTTFDRPGYLKAAMGAGAAGFLLKGESGPVNVVGVPHPPR